MQISSRFSIAIHMFTCIEYFKGDYKITSEFIADSVGVNPVIIRKIMSQLRDAGLVDVARGTEKHVYHNATIRLLKVLEEKRCNWRKVIIFWRSVRERSMIKSMNTQSYTEIITL